MKRAKILLSAIAILAVVGGALAFKAQRFTPGPVFCATIQNEQITCTAQAPQVLYTTIQNNRPSTTAPCLSPFLTSITCTTTNTNVTAAGVRVWEFPED